MNSFKLLSLVVIFLLLTNVPLVSAAIPQKDYSDYYVVKVGDTIAMDHPDSARILSPIFWEWRTLDYNKEYFEYVGHSWTGRLVFKALKAGDSIIYVTHGGLTPPWKFTYKMHAC